MKLRTNSLQTREVRIKSEPMLVLGIGIKSSSRESCFVCSKEEERIG